jgi:hypothetical protein
MQRRYRTQYGKYNIMFFKRAGVKGWGDRVEVLRVVCISFLVHCLCWSNEGTISPLSSIVHRPPLSSKHSAIHKLTNLYNSTLKMEAVTTTQEQNKT